MAEIIFKRIVRFARAQRVKFSNIKLKMKQNDKIQVLHLDVKGNQFCQDRSGAICPESE